MSTHRAFGLDLDTEFALPGLSPLPVEGDALLLALSTRIEVERVFSGDCDPARSWRTVIDERPYEVARGRRGDLIFRWGDSRFHLSEDARRLLCAPDDPDHPGWRRVLLDSVLVTAALERGHEALHAGAVEIAGAAVGVLAPTGGGKSTLLAELVARGRPLVSDDVLVLEPGARPPACLPGPPLMNLARAPALTADPGGTVLAEMGDENWTVVPGTARARLPLAALFVLERSQAQVGARAAPIGSAAVVLLEQALRSGESPQRRTARFHAVADVAEQVPCLHLAAGTGVAPGELADTVEGALERRKTACG